MDMQEKYRQQLDISYSYHLAKRMEKHRTNEELSDGGGEGRACNRGNAGAGDAYNRFSDYP